jgi:Uma2 family endonuclease
MNLALPRCMSLAEFLRWEERQTLRYEFDGIGPVAMTGGTASHSQIQTNLAISIGGRLRGKSCNFHGSHLKVQTADGHVRYPDGFVVCSPLTGGEQVIHDPIVIFEVLSPTTERIDRFVKAREYQAMPSVQRYVMLEQDTINAIVYARSGESWTHEILVADSVLALPEIGVELPLADLYEGVAVKAQEDADHPPEVESG